VTPFAFAIGADGRVRSKGLCGDPIRLRDLLAMAGFDEAARAMEPAAEAYIDEHDQRRKAHDGKAGVR
jgi:hypothetical protein